MLTVHTCHAGELCQQLVQVVGVLVETCLPRTHARTSSSRISSSTAKTILKLQKSLLQTLLQLTTFLIIAMTEFYRVRLPHSCCLQPMKHLLVMSPTHELPGRWQSVEGALTRHSVLSMPDKPADSMHPGPLPP